MTSSSSQLGSLFLGSGFHSSLFLFQIQKVVIALGDYQDIQCHACIGGTNVRADIAKLEMGQQVVVGTPGRVFDMINRNALGNGWEGREGRGHE